MKKRILVVFGGTVLLLTQATISRAEDRIQAFVSKGKIVFTNLVENPPVPEVTRAVLTRASSASRGEIPPSLNSLVNEISKTHGVDPALVKAVMKTESGYNQFAISPKGAMGLMQLIAGTGKRFGVTDFFDPQQNIEGGVRYLKFLIQKFEGNLDLSIAAYNAGENLVQRLGRIPAIPETRDYVRKVRSIYQPTLVAENSVPLSKRDDIAAARVEQTAPIFRMVDQRGVVHFSNIEPPY